MFRKFNNFFTIFFNSMKEAYNGAMKKPIETDAQKWRDIQRRNFVAACINKLANLALNGATIAVRSDDARAEPLMGLCDGIMTKGYEILESMYGDGDFWIFPAVSAAGEVFNTGLTQPQVRILDMQGDRITDAYGIIDWYTEQDTENTYFLLRRHQLDPNGTLIVSYSVMNENERKVRLPQWDYIDGKTVKYVGANHIGFGRFKSPVSSRGLSPVYGVPLNFGCAPIEREIFEDLKSETSERKNAKSIIFTDPRNLKRNDSTGKNEFADNIFAIQPRDGQSGKNIDIYAPEMRFAQFNEKTVTDFRAFEAQIGVDRGFLTDYDTGTAVTATEVRRANAGTIGMIEKTHAAMSKGIDETIKADLVFLGVRPEYELKIEWFDPFQDESSQWRMLLDGYEADSAENRDLIKWLFPNMSEQEIDEKIDRINAKKTADTDRAVENALRGI